MASADSPDRVRTGRDVLDTPPKSPKIPSRKMSTLAGTKGKAATPADDDDEDDAMLNSPEGETGDGDDDEGSDLNSHPVVQAFDHWGEATQHLQILSTIAPELMAPIQDMITMINQMLPVWASTKLSGNANGTMSALGGAGTSPLGMLAGTSPMGQPGMPMGGGVGPGGGGGMMPPGVGGGGPSGPPGM